MASVRSRSRSANRNRLGPRASPRATIVPALSRGHASVSHHLGVLKAADLVATEREGQFIRYRLNTTVFQEVVRYFMIRFGAGEDGRGKADA